jgi:hypothetical protein
MPSGWPRKRGPSRPTSPLRHPDNGAAIGSGPDQQGGPNMGDIRVSGYNFGNNIRGQAYMPPPVNNYSIAGDVQFNTGAYFKVGASIRLARTDGFPLCQRHELRVALKRKRLIVEGQRGPRRPQGVDGHERAQYFRPR